MKQPCEHNPRPRWRQPSSLVAGVAGLVVALVVAGVVAKVYDAVSEHLLPRRGRALRPGSSILDCTPSLAKESPWLVLHECITPPHALLRIATSAGIPGPGLFSGLVWDRLLGIFIFLAGVAFAVFSIKDIHYFFLRLMAYGYNNRDQNASGKEEPKHGSTSWSPSATGDGAESNVKEVEPEEDVRPEWSVLGIVLLTAYRFYTGFLSATWLPYLLAMEGQYLWAEQQALFMALAKLIYALSILMNPLFGLVGDEAVAISHGVGRRLFIRIGLTLAAVGLYICVLAGRDGGFLSFLSGILVWRLGEALNDVTTEALVPELVPPKQYQLASGIKASAFMLGGLFGYLLLIVFADKHYSWLYYAYPIGMFLASLPPLYLLDEERPVVHAKKRKDQETFMDSMVQAYLSPMRYSGGFPLACVAVLVFSLGTAPMFFLLLIVRDLVGIKDPVVQQQHFSLGSIVFFLSAAAASCLSTVAKPREGSQAQAQLLKGRLLVSTMVAFGIVVFIIPCLSLLHEIPVRNTVFYILTVVFGGAFGSAFTLFQDLTWQLLPPGIRVANAMGFNVMCRLFGVGLGNFISGMILDLAYSSETEGYNTWGYVVMHTFSGIVVLTSVPLAHAVVSMGVKEELEPLQPRAAA